jgi:gluconate 2-dehydrogenase gamma chain
MSPIRECATWRASDWPPDLEMQEAGNRKMRRLSGIFLLARRGFFRLGLGSAAGILATPALAEALKGYQPENLTRQELLALTALMSRLIPADETHGGAAEAEAYVYVDRALGGYFAQHLATYREALAGLDLLARAAGHANFAAMPEAAMDETIARMEKGELSAEGFTGGGRTFFNLVRRHTLEGYLCDPMYGGNRDFIGWEALGYPGIQLYYGPETQRLNGTDDRDPRSIADFGGRPRP